MMGHIHLKKKHHLFQFLGLEDFHLLSLRSVKYPRCYVRHFRDNIIISPVSDNDVFLKDNNRYVYKFNLM